MCSSSALIFEVLSFCDVIQVVPVVQVTSGCPLVSSSGVCQLVVMPGLGHGGGISGWRTLGHQDNPNLMKIAMSNNPQVALLRRKWFCAERL